MSRKYSSRHDIVFKLCWCFYERVRNGSASESVVDSSLPVGGWQGVV